MEWDGDLGREVRRGAWEWIRSKGGGREVKDLGVIYEEGNPMEERKG